MFTKIMLEFTKMRRESIMIRIGHMEEGWRSWITENDLLLDLSDGYISVHLLILYNTRQEKIKSIKVTLK